MDQHVSTRNVLLFGTHGNHPEGSTQALLKRCREHPVAERWWLTIAGDAQLQIEHALDLSYNDLAVFLVDGDGDGPAVEFHAIGAHSDEPLAPSNGPVTPEEVLHTLAALSRRTELPQCYVLTVREPGNDANNSQESAYGLLLSLLENPQPEHWASHLR